MNAEDEQYLTKSLINHLEKAFNGMRNTLYDLQHYADPQSTIPKDRRTQIGNLLLMWFRPAANQEAATAKAVADVYDKILFGWASKTIKIRCDKKCANNPDGILYTKTGIFGSPNTIFICPKYEGLGDQEQILGLIHESSHLYAKTKDFGYYNSIDKKNVVQYDMGDSTKPIVLTSAQLVNNADTYSNFVAAMGYGGAGKK